MRGMWVWSGMLVLAGALVGCGSETHSSGVSGGAAGGGGASTGGAGGTGAGSGAGGTGARAGSGGARATGGGGAAGAGGGSAGGASFQELCAKPGVLRCVDFDKDLSDAEFNQPAGGNQSDPHKPVVDSNTAYEGTGALKLTFNGANGADTTGTVGYAFPQVKTGDVFVSLRMRFGDGLQTKMQAQEFGTAAGMKYLGLVPAEKSCDAQEVYISDNSLYAIFTGVPQMYHTCSGWPYRSGLPGSEGDDWQPVEGSIDNCGFDYILGVRNADGSVKSPPCVLFTDDTWHLLELQVAIPGAGSPGRTRLWIDGVLTVDQPGAKGQHGVLVPKGPYGRVYLNNYSTGYKGQQAGNGTLGNGLWRTWYDNLIMSSSCITSC